MFHEIFQARKFQEMFTTLVSTVNHPPGCHFAASSPSAIGMLFLCIQFAERNLLYSFNAVRLYLLARQFQDMSVLL